MTGLGTKWYGTKCFGVRVYGMSTGIETSLFISPLPIDIAWAIIGRFRDFYVGFFAHYVL